MKILVLANVGMGLYKFRKEVLEELIKQNYEVYISLPYDNYVPKLQALGCTFIETKMSRRGTNPLQDIKLFMNYLKIMKRIKPDVVLTYTIKPNVYGGIACAFTHTPFIANITGLGTAVQNKGIMQKITLLLYKFGLKKAACVFFQNQSNRKFFKDHHIVKGKTRLIPGSGVNLEQHKFEVYPHNHAYVRFLFIGRMMKAKGIEELMQAAQIIKEKYPEARFDFIGGMEEDYTKQLQQLENENVIHYYGQQDDVHSFIKQSHATILPSYHEGLANVLLESASAGRPVLASRVPGCMETFEEGLTGYGFDAKCVDSLVQTIVKFIQLPYEQKKAMGIAARKKMEKEFDRKLIVNAYLEEIENITKKGDHHELIREVS